MRGREKWENIGGGNKPGGMAAIYSGGPAAILHKTHTIALLVVDDFYFADTIALGGRITRRRNEINS